jgi:general secretion pathway protein J
MTLLEVVVAVAVMAMISLLLYGAFDALSRGKRGEAARADRSRQGREAMSRITREMTSAYLSLHNPLQPSLFTRRTVFVGEHTGSEGDRVDFASFSHRRLTQDVPESDQAEIGYFVSRDPSVTGKVDLVRREQTPLDMEPRQGGVTNVLAEDIESFELKYLDPLTGQWIDTWDSTNQTGQLNRLPLQVKVTLVLKGIKDGAPLRFQTKFTVPMRDPLTFGQPR